MGASAPASWPPGFPPVASRPESAGDERLDARVVLLAAAGAVAWLLLANSVTLLGEDERLGALGAAAPYGTLVPFVVSSALLVVGATALSRRMRPSRVGRLVVLGATLQLLSALCGVAVRAVLQAGGAGAVGSVLDLLHTDAALAAASLWCFCGAALSHARRSEPLRGSLRLLGLAIAIGSVSQCYALGSQFDGTTPSLRATMLLSELPTLLMWSGIAASLLAMGRAVIGRGRWIAACCELGAVGSALLALTTGCQLVVSATELARPLTPTGNLVLFGAATTCVAWGIATVSLLLGALGGPGARRGRLWRLLDRALLPRSGDATG